jgi:hypothetical protein
MSKLSAIMLVVLAACHSRDAADVIARYRTSERRVAAAPNDAPRKWAVGEWTLYKVSNGTTVGYTKHSVVAVSACGTWIESIFVADKYDDRLIIKSCFQNLKPGPLSDGFDDIQAVMMRHGQRNVVMDFRNGQNPRTKQMMKAEYARFSTLAWQSAPATDEQEIVVPAGHFIGAQKIVTRLLVEQSLHTTQAWIHSAVPMGGTIKVVGDTGEESVLLDFGVSGAESELPGFDEHLAESGLD